MNTTKLSEIFKKLVLQYERGTGDATLRYVGHIEQITGLQYVNGSDPTNLLLKIINREDFNKYVIRCPVQKENFIILDKEIAEKILVLGI